MIDRPRAETAIRELLLSLGYDPTSDALVDTPKRVAKAWEEMLHGKDIRAVDVLDRRFECDHNEIVTCRGIDFWSTCEHHLLPFYGTAAVSYIPNEGSRVVGLSKLARLVDMHARRLQLQERMTKDIADDLMTHLGAAGVGVVVKARHLCMGCRGVGKPNAEMVTSAMRGVCRSDASLEARLLHLLSV
jgi:GTP cyclohydrolase I